jgi:leucyl-tRNA synthetase
MDFYQLFNSWYNKNSDKRRIFQPNTLFERNTVNAVCDENIDPFSANEWNAQKDTQENPLAIPIDVLAETK